MSPKKSTKLSAGATISVNDGVTVPEFPEIDASGWTGMVLEAQGRGATLKYIIEWDDATLAKIPQHYVDHCESNGLLHSMACFPASDVGPA